MKTRFFFLLLITWLLSIALAPAQDIYINVSFKVILNPADGNRPSGVTDDLITTKVAEMNTLLAATFRGYRLRLATAPVNIGGLGDTTGPSTFFNTDFDQGNLFSLKNAINAHLTLYAWDNNAVNIYVNQATATGDSLVYTNELIALGPFGLNRADLTLHEIGHFYHLVHTQGTGCEGICVPGTTFGICFTTPGDDSISDTLPDACCWTQNEIAQHNYSGASYNSLTSVQKTNVDNVYFNLMSYHIFNYRSRLTELQMDLWTDVGNDNASRRSKQSGRTYFVDILSVLGNGSSKAAFPNVAAGVNAASAGDIVLIRPGPYNEQMRITKAVTLRATRAGPVYIGSTGPP